MKFKFSKNLDYQMEAVNAIVDIFDTGKNIVGGEKAFELQSVSSVIKNELEIDNARIIQNTHDIQKRNKLDLSEISTSGGIGVAAVGTEVIGVSRAGSSRLKSGMDFSIEMETGTGKTYVYLRTIFELNKQYGLKKFIILVPSVAIREGVLKTLEQTKEHFKDLYNIGYSYFAYDSKKLSKVREFSQSLDVQIMVMTIQSFNSDDRVMRQTPDRFNGESPLNLVAATNPVVIMDEPQNMGSDLSRAAIRDLKSLFKLRYSATHKEIHNLMYRLTPVDAYKSGLVKKIEVFGVDDSQAGDLIFHIREIKVQKGKAPQVKVGLEIKNANGEFVVGDKLLSVGTDLGHKTKNEKYKDLIINEIDARQGKVELSNGKIFKQEEKNEDNEEAVFRTQIKETIKEHFRKQEEVGDKVKVLSLFFIDRVENYVASDGIIRKIFTEEFERLKNSSKYYKDKETETVHNGYFAKKKIRGQDVFQNSNGKTQADKEVYDLIMKNKEKLLSFAESTCFVFSHSALREGWDNPNVFQICTLNETTSQMKKRQEIGRGLRLAVDIEGNRIFDSRVNILTVIPNESYKEFIGGLQAEYDEAGYREMPEAGNARERVDINFKYTKNLPEDFENLWNKIKKKTKYNIALNKEKLVGISIEKINNELNVNNLVVRVEKVIVDFDENGKINTVYENMSIGEKLKEEIRVGNFIERIAKETGVTRHTIFQILSKVENLDLIFKNPEEYVRSVTIIIKNSLNELLINEGLQYLPTKYIWEISLFDKFEGYKNKSIPSEKSVYDRVAFDSGGERIFAESLEISPKVILFTKLPSSFAIDTPLGTYNPDWAIVMKTDEGEKLYLVRETKFDYRNLEEELSAIEKQKILCGKKHFEAIGVDFKVSEKKDLSDII